MSMISTSDVINTRCMVVLMLLIAPIKKMCLGVALNDTRGKVFL